ISGNGQRGIHLGGGGAHVVQGNRIGVDASGDTALPNAWQGIEMENSNNNTIGGTSNEAGNIVSGNLRHGISLTANSTANKIWGNHIGTNGSGTDAVPNG